MSEPEGAPPSREGGGGYAVPPQHLTPPDGARPYPWVAGGAHQAPAGPAASRPGPPLVPSEDPATSPWGVPVAPPAGPDPWAPGGLGSTALLDRPTMARRPVVAPPVRPLPPPPPAQSWTWERSNGGRNALIAAATVLLVGALIAAFIVFRNRNDVAQDLSEPPPVIQPADVTVPPVDPSASLDPVAGTEATLPSIPPVVLEPVAPATTVPPAPTTAPPASPPPTQAAVVTAPSTRSTAVPPSTASPPYTGGPIPSTSTTVPRTTTSSRG